MFITCTRKIGFDAAHRVMLHETKCKNLHGHNWDHGCILKKEDTDIIKLCDANNFKVFVLNDNPTAENMAAFLLDKANSLLEEKKIKVVEIKLWETPNCYAIARYSEI